MTPENLTEVLTILTLLSAEKYNFTGSPRSFLLERITLLFTITLLRDKVRTRPATLPSGLMSGNVALPVPRGWLDSAEGALSGAE